MKRTLIVALFCAAAAWSTGSQSALKNIENAYEVEAAAVLLPETAGGQMMVHPCPSCKTVFLPTDANTQYKVGPGGSAMSLADFRAAVKKSPKGLCTIIYRLDNKVVTHVNLAAS
jgi:hypothetical protein